MKEIYIDEKCPVCSSPFKEGDDIVVCPDCAAPYHRSCYKEQGKCVFLDRHGEYKWKGEKAAFKERCENLHSAQMKAMNDAEGERSEELYNVRSFEEFKEAMDKKVLREQKDFPEVQEVTAEELIKFCGKNAAYYLPIFRDMIKYGKIMKLNFSAFLFFPLHCFFRRMNLFGTVTLFVIMILTEVRTLLADTNNILGLTPDMTRLCTVLVTAAMLAALIFLLMFFNYFYLKFAVRKIKNIKSEYASCGKQEIMKRIAEAGRPSLFSGVVFGLGVGMIMSLAFQILNNYLAVAL